MGSGGRVDNEVFRVARQVPQPIIERRQPSDRRLLLRAFLEPAKRRGLGVIVGKSGIEALGGVIGGEVSRAGAFTAHNIGVG